MRWRENRGSFTVRNFIVCTHPQISLGMWHAWERREVYKVLVGNPEGKKPLGRPRRRWKDGIRMDLREIGLGDVDWIRLAQYRDR
jgi:hypothetical protein